MTPIISLALVLQLHNLAGAPPSVIDSAASELTRVCGQLGVSAEWRARSTHDETVHIVVLRRETGALRRREDTVMGAAVRTPTGAGVVYVFYDRVRSEAERYAVSTPLVLACAIAHEIGHLLLPGRSHSADGMMRARWTRDDFQRAEQGSLRFSRDEIASVRSGVP